VFSTPFHHIVSVCGVYPQSVNDEYRIHDVATLPCRALLSTLTFMPYMLTTT
jgi:hypothetical protein